MQWQVAVDDRGAMIVEDLAVKMAASQERGEVPFFIQATAGTTVLGGM
jgi:hypothetical protein